MGFEVNIICRRSSQRNIVFRMFAWCKWRLIPHIWRFKIFTNMPLIAAEGFKQKYLTETTHPFFSEYSLKKYFQQKGFDAVIVGSD